MNRKIEWLSILQGWSMLLVVIGHVTLTNIFNDPATPFSSAVERIIYSFHMPLFMVISGYLFYYTKISRNEKYYKTIFSKLKRLGIPFCFFTFSTFLLKFIFNPMMRRPVELSFDQIVNCFLYPSSNPLGEMWFIATLLFIFLFYPIFKWSLQVKWRVLTVAGITIALNLFFPAGITLFCISQIAYYLVFFYIGILLCKYQYINKLPVGIWGLVFILFNVVYPLPLITPFVGVMFSIGLCQWLAKFAPRLFASFRNFTFQIFLMGIFFQIGMRFLYLKLQIDTLYWPMYFASILIALYIPVAISKLILRLNNKFLNQFFGL